MRAAGRQAWEAHGHGAAPSCFTSTCRGSCAAGVPEHPQGRQLHTSARGGFLPRHDEDLREPLVRRQGSQVSMRVARGRRESGSQGPWLGEAAPQPEGSSVCAQPASCPVEDSRATFRPQKLSPQLLLIQGPAVACCAGLGRKSPLTEVRKSGSGSHVSPAGWLPGVSVIKEIQGSR